jgi:hypothetical protein
MGGVGLFDLEMVSNSGFIPFQQFFINVLVHELEKP